MLRGRGGALQDYSNILNIVIQLVEWMSFKTNHEKICANEESLKFLLAVLPYFSDAKLQELFEEKTIESISSPKIKSWSEFIPVYSYFFGSAGATSPIDNLRAQLAELLRVRRSSHKPSIALFLYGEGSYSLNHKVYIAHAAGLFQKILGSFDNAVTSAFSLGVSAVRGYMGKQ